MNGATVGVGFGQRRNVHGLSGPQVSDSDSAAIERGDLVEPGGEHGELSAIGDFHLTRAGKRELLGASRIDIEKRVDAWNGFYRAGGEQERTGRIGVFFGLAIGERVAARRKVRTRDRPLIYSRHGESNNEQEDCVLNIRRRFSRRARAAASRLVNSPRSTPSRPEMIFSFCCLSCWA